MKGLNARRIKIIIANLWETPPLHILLTEEDDVVVARCLDFTISSHGENEEDALCALAEAIEEYLLTAIENKAVDTIFDLAQGKYWRMFNELEANQSIAEMKRTINSSLKNITIETVAKSMTQIVYA